MEIVLRTTLHPSEKYTLQLRVSLDISPGFRLFQRIGVHVSIYSLHGYRYVDYNIIELNFDDYTRTSMALADFVNKCISRLSKDSVELNPRNNVELDSLLYQVFMTYLYVTKKLGAQFTGLTYESLSPFLDSIINSTNIVVEKQNINLSATLTRDHNSNNPKKWYLKIWYYDSIISQSVTYRVCSPDFIVSSGFYTDIARLYETQESPVSVGILCKSIESSLIETLAPIIDIVKLGVVCIH